MISEDVLRTGIEPTPYQKPFKLVTGTQSRVANFQGANKQFSFLSISFVYDKSNQNRSIYDSYYAKLASTKIKSIKLENASNTYRSFNSIKFDTMTLMINFYSIINLLVLQRIKYSTIVRLHT